MPSISRLIASEVIPHPSFIVPDEDSPTLLERSNVPLLIQSCEFDTAFPAEVIQEGDDILGNGSMPQDISASTFLIVLMDLRCAVTCLPDLLVKAGKEDAFKSTVEWFSKF
ncbi:hypothetical protein M422DRAFT_242187 [Sphaerobolus stellatus SS14]|nr:hypothetical protein M422DRAFT_242187 [Sphaerobolus stellatus SS14]